MAKKSTMADIAPPSREEKTPAVPMFQSTKEGDTSAVNVRMEAGRARYLRMLSASTGRSQRELLEYAVDLLRKEAGEV